MSMWPHCSRGFRKAPAFNSQTKPAVEAADFALPPNDASRYCVCSRAQKGGWRSEAASVYRSSRDSGGSSPVRRIFFPPPDCSLVATAIRRQELD